MTLHLLFDLCSVCFLAVMLFSANQAMNVLWGISKDKGAGYFCAFMALISLVGMAIFAQLAGV